MKKKTAVVFLLFFLLGVFSRVIFASKDFTHLDGVLYALGSTDFSIKDGTPPSPGYFIYVMSAKFLNLFTHNPHNSLMFLSIFYSGLLAGLLYYFGKILRGSAAGIICAVLFLTSPLFWYKGITIFGYLNSGFFVLTTALLTYLITVKGKEGLGLWLAVSLGILLGIRQQELIVMAPLFIYALFHMKPREAFFSLSALTAVCLLWLIPLVIISGGLKEYTGVLKSGSVYVVEDSVLGGAFASKLNNHLIRMVQTFERAYLLGILPLIYYSGRFFYIPSIIEDKRTRFFAVWIFPCLIYNVFIQFGEVGHGMSWALGFLLILAEAVVILAEDMLAALGILSVKVLGVVHNDEKKKCHSEAEPKNLKAEILHPLICPDRSRRGIQNDSLRNIGSHSGNFLGLLQCSLKAAAYSFVIVPVVSANLFMFFYDFDKDENAPFYSFEQYTQSNYNYVLKKNRFLTTKINFIKQNFKPQECIIIASSVFVNQVMYYFPEAVVIQSGALDREKRTLFWYCRGHKRAFYKDKRSFSVPEGFTTMLIFDDKFIPYAAGAEELEYYDVGGYKLAAVKVTAGDEINFGFHSIEVD